MERVMQILEHAKATGRMKQDDLLYVVLAMAERVFKPVVLANELNSKRK